MTRCPTCGRECRYTRRGRTCHGCREAGIILVHPAPAPGSYRVVPPELDEGTFGTGDASLVAGEP